MENVKINALGNLESEGNQDPASEIFRLLEVAGTMASYFEYGQTANAVALALAVHEPLRLRNGG